MQLYNEMREWVVAALVRIGSESRGNREVWSDPADVSLGTRAIHSVHLASQVAIVHRLDSRKERRAGGSASRVKNAAVVNTAA